jgi:cytidyltransferase-like protein
VVITWRQRVVKIMIAGSFDPIHEGHLIHIQTAKELGGPGSELVVITHADAIIDAHKPLPCLLPLKTRMALLKALGADYVFESVDKDGTVAKTIRLVKPTMFVKDGDRKADNLPPDEIAACQEVGCEIVYLNNGKDNSSSRLKELFLEKVLSIMTIHPFYPDEVTFSGKSSKVQKPVDGIYQHVPDWKVSGESFPF